MFTALKSPHSSVHINLLFFQYFLFLGGPRTISRRLQMPDGQLTDEPELTGHCNGHAVKQECDDSKDISRDDSIEARKGDSDKDTKVSDNSDTKEYARGDLVWLRIRGHPWWPCVVVQISDVPRQTRKVWTVGWRRFLRI
jgi:hypothetical protein